MRRKPSFQLRPVARTVAATLCVVFVAGCGTFQLASAVYPPSGKSQEQQQLDNLSCKDNAKNEANTAGRQAGAFALGLTIVGAPVDYELEKSKQREVYKGCMEARGYRVVNPTDGTAVATSTLAPVQTPKVQEPVRQVSAAAVVSQAPQAPPGADVATQLQKLSELRDKGLISAEEYDKKRNEILARL